MTPRAWLLALAAALAGIVAALTWPSAPANRRVVVEERQLLGIDLQVFLTVCAQIETDRAQFESGGGGAEIPSGLSMGQFAAVVSNAPDKLAGTCGRAGVELEDFLQILAMMEKTSSASARLKLWDETFERRAVKAEAIAKSYEATGATPPPAPAPEDRPAWYLELSPAVRDSIPVWIESAKQAGPAWRKAMGLANPDDELEDEENPK